MTATLHTGELTTCLDAARAYAKRGLRVIPVQGIRAGKCTCQDWRDKNDKGPCSTPGKHPRFRNWTERATTDATEIEKWFRHDFKGSNVGIVTGADSGIFVLDVDPKNGGEDSLDALQAKHGRLPNTLQALTGSGGQHFYFGHPGGTVPNAVCILPGLDIRGDGGQVVAAPSMHTSGRHYAWDGMADFDAPILPAPQWLLDLIFSQDPKHRGSSKKPTEIPEIIRDGAKHQTCVSLAGSMRRRGCNSEEIYAALLKLAERFETTVPPENLRAIAEDIQERYAPMPQIFPLTELGNAERFAAQHGANVRYCYDWRAWLVWDGQRWQRDSGAEVRRLAKLTVRSIYAEASQQSAEGQRRALAAWGARSESSSAIESMLKLAQSEASIPVAAGDLDVDRWLLNVENGTLDLHTGELRPHRREDLISKLAPVHSDPAARYPRWLRFLDEVFAPHPDIAPFIQRAVGYSLTGDTREECLFLMHGTGRNGKGTLLKTLALALGDYAGTADFSTFVQRRDDSGPRDDVANMRGKRLVSAQESREGAALAESLLKWLTGGDLVRARRLYENSYEFDPSWKIWLATNHKPVIRGTDPAIWSRIKLLPFDVSFEGREDRTLKTALLAELPGILNWAVEGCLRWQEDGLQLPASVTDATDEYRADSDQTRRFITEVCIEGDYASGKARSLYAGYRKWASDAGEEPVTETAFCRRLSEHGFGKRKTETGMKYDGIGLRADVK